MSSFVDHLGTRIFYDVYRPEGPIRGIVQLAHGYGEHAGRYGRLVDALVRHGYAVYADDHRGHGRTGLEQHSGNHARLGYLGRGGVGAAIASLDEFTELIRTENPGVPLVLIGHSWGSFMAQILVNRHPERFAAVVLSGTILRQLGAANMGDLNARWNGPGTTGMEWLSPDPLTVHGFIDDSLCTTVPMRRTFGLVNQLRMMGVPSRRLPRDLPVLLVVGREDPVGGPRSVHRLAHAYRTRAGLTDVTTLVYPGQRHEILNEESTTQPRADVVAWLDARIPERA